MKAVRVFHGEFTSTHDAKAGPYFVPKLGLNLVGEQRQLPIGFDLAANDVGDHFFVCGAVAEFAVVPVFEPQEFLAVQFPSSAFLPQFGRLDAGQEHFLAANAVHFLADNLLHFFQHAQAEGQDGINTCGQLPDHSGTHHQFMADDFSISR